MFDFNTVENFDNHIRLSIPNYDQLVDTFSGLASIYSEPDTVVIDFGCSTGKFLLDLPKKDGCTYIGVDNCNLIPDNHPDINFYKNDAIEFDKLGYNDSASVVISMFFLQFLSKSKRAEMLIQLHKHINDGAILLIAEKVLLDDNRIDNIISRLHISEKRKYFTDTEILDKDRQILNSMHTVNHSQLISELSKMGHVIKVWQSYNFCGFVVKK